jgi:hypothetical protein
MRKSEIIHSHQVKTLLNCLRDNGWSEKIGTQEDASEFLVWLLDTFTSPFLVLSESIHHGLDKGNDDEKVLSERIIPLSIPEGKNPISLFELLKSHFFDNQVSLTRNTNERDLETSAWKTLSLMPFYGSSSKSQRYPEKMILPIVLKRYTNEGRRITRPIAISHKLDVTDLISQSQQDSSRFSLELKSVVCHTGGSGIESGHYTSFAAHILDGELLWIKSDDLSYTTHFSSLSQVQNVFVNELPLQSYILFYELQADSLFEENLDTSVLQSLVEKKREGLKLFHWRIY